MAYTTIDRPKDYFKAKLHTGDASNHQTVNVGFRPDWIWLKSRTHTYSHYILDTSRQSDGSSMPSGDANMYNYLLTNATDAEADNNSDGIVQTSTGFIVDQDSQSLGEGGQSATSTVGENMASYSWIANGGSLTTNDASATSIGTIDSQYQVNTTAGFSIVTYTGNGTAGASWAHGLGSVPHWIIVKGRNLANDWAVYHKANTSAPETDFVNLQSSDATSDSNTRWNDTAPTSTVVTVGNNAAVNGNTYNYVAYCFTEKQGYSKFGSYVGNNNADGPFVYTGFKPAWVLIKATAGSENWGLFDNVRNKEPNNPRDIYFTPSTNAADSSESDSVDFLSNGFKWRIASGFRNGDGVSFIYAAFAESPFVTSNGVCANAG